MPVHVEGFDGGDRTTVELPAAQEHLLEALGATGKPLIVVLTAGSAVAVPWAKDHADAILAAWYPGEESGNAIADVLKGAYNPAGRLPVTFYRSTADLPAFTDYSMKNRTYRYFKGDVMYGFGFGLSYSKFVYRIPSLGTATIRAGDPVTVWTDVRNMSDREGDEVTELYVVPPQTSVSPQVELEGFQRIHLRPGERKRVEFTLTPRELSEVDEKGDRAVLPGDYTICIAGAQPEPGAPTAKLHVEGTVALPR
jgi:beta-glucosidase